MPVPVPVPGPALRLKGRPGALAEVAQLPPRRPGPAEQRLSAGGTGTAGQAGPAPAAASPHLSRQGAAPEGAGPAAAAGEGARRRLAAPGAAQP